MIGKIFCCAGADEIRRRAKLGDSRAIADLIELMPRDLPRRFRQRRRDEALLELGRWLRTALPASSINAVASVVAAAAKARQSGRAIVAEGPIAMLTGAELRELTARVDEALAVSPVNGRGDGLRMRRLSALFADATADVRMRRSPNGGDQR